MAKRNSKRREWTKTDVRELKNSCSGKNSREENCSDAEEDRRRDSAEGF